MSAIFHRHTGMQPPRAVDGDGCYIIDDAGRRYLDASGGAAVSCLGHSDPDVIAAIKDQVDHIAFAHTGFFTSAPAEELATFLTRATGGALSKVYFVSGGSEAVEAAMKLARQYMVEIGQPQRRHFIARWQSYHGNTLGGLSVGGNRPRREMYAPILLDAHHIEPCFAYRHRRDDETEDAYGQRVADALYHQIKELGPETVIAFVAETVVGATIGAVPAVPGYFARVRDICDEFGILLILDEVMCGMGRTGSLFAFEQEGITPDIVAVAKGLGAGYQPLGALLCTQGVFDAIAAGSGFFQHGHTYMGHPTACAAGLAVQRKIAGDGLLDNVRVMGDRLDDALQQAFGNHPNVGDIRGRGLFRAIELVADRTTKAPFDASLRLHAQIKSAALANGLVCYPMGGTADGVSGDHILLAPPFIVDERQVDDMTEILQRSVADVLRKVRE